MKYFGGMHKPCIPCHRASGHGQSIWYDCLGVFFVELLWEKPHSDSIQYMPSSTVGNIDSVQAYSIDEISEVYWYSRKEHMPQYGIHNI